MSKLATVPMWEASDVRVRDPVRSLWEGGTGSGCIEFRAWARAWGIKSGACVTPGAEAWPDRPCRAAANGARRQAALPGGRKQERLPVGAFPYGAAFSRFAYFW
ncbi:hypothetical protein GCM10027081_40300 [Cupriavidus yeoncheonensis]